MCANSVVETETKISDLFLYSCNDPQKEDMGLECRGLEQQQKVLGGKVELRRQILIREI